MCVGCIMLKALPPDPWSGSCMTRELGQRNHCRLALVGGYSQEGKRKFSMSTVQPAVQGAILISAPYHTLHIPIHCPTSKTQPGFFHISDTTTLSNLLSSLTWTNFPHPHCYLHRSQRHILETEIRYATFMLWIKRNSFLCPSILSITLYSCPSRYYCLKSLTCLPATCLSHGL